METFTVQPASVYFTIIQAIKVVSHKYSVLGERWDARGPQSSPASKEQGLQQQAWLLACHHAAGSRHWCSAQPNGRMSESENPQDCFHWLKLGVSGFSGGRFLYFLPSFEAQEYFGYWKNVLKTLGAESKWGNSLKGLLEFKVEILKNIFYVK